MGMVCCTELETAKIQEKNSGSTPLHGSECKDSDLFKEPRQPNAASAVCEDAERNTAEEQAIALKQLKAAARIQANFRGQKTRESVSQIRESTVVQHHEDPDLNSVDVTTLTLQSKPNRMNSKQEISPRTLAAFDSTPMRCR
mmetsp:Transcript_5250/g.14531  ORF Transcript_5250/g.14531 Transcript_5250/m.14531 type:complete len:142 (-) Transcript_5250:223-648(-)